MPKNVTEFDKAIVDLAKATLPSMILPNGDRFGDLYPGDLLAYADKTMEEIIQILVDPASDNEVRFLEDGTAPA
jgi:hypothetical protein